MSTTAAVTALSQPPRVASALLPAVDGRAGAWSTHFAPSSSSWAGVHGGVVVGTLLQVASSAVERPVTSITAHLHAAVEQGPGQLALHIDHAGRTVSSARVSLVQERLRATATALLTRDSGTAPRTVTGHVSGARSGDAAPEELDRLEAFDSVMPFARHLDIRPLGEARPLAGGDDPTLRAWIRPTDALPYSQPLAVVLLDALAPSLYAVLHEPVAIPTVEFTAHLAPHSEVDEHGWYHLEQRTVWATDTVCVDQAELHAPDGQLLAQARQVRRVFPAV